MSISQTHPQKNLPTTTRTSTVSKLESYIDNDKKYDETAESRHKKEILLELKNNFSTQTKESELLQSLKSQISSLKSEITFLREELKEKGYAVRTLLNMKCKSIDDCTSSTIVKSPRKSRIEISDTIIIQRKQLQNQKSRSWVL